MNIDIQLKIYAKSLKIYITLGGDINEDNAESLKHKIKYMGKLIIGGSKWE
jgi:anti-anti-sigma regulatory factor